MIFKIVERTWLAKSSASHLEQTACYLQRLTARTFHIQTADNKEAKEEDEKGIKPAPPIKRTTSITQAPAGGHDLDIGINRSTLDPQMMDWLDERQVRISRPSKNVMQSGTFTTQTWKIDFNSQMRWENWLMGWTSTADPMSNLSLNFPTKESAIDFCEKNKLSWFVEEQPQRQVRRKSYADNFSWNKRTRLGNK